METKQENKRWHLIRNDNGEWISDEYAVFVSKLEATVLRIQAAKQGKLLAIQHGPEGSLWCYKHELETIEFTSNNSETKQRTLSIKKNYNNKKDER